MYYCQLALCRPNEAVRSRKRAWKFAEANSVRLLAKARTRSHTHISGLIVEQMRAKTNE